MCCFVSCSVGWKEKDHAAGPAEFDGILIEIDYLDPIYIYKGRLPDFKISDFDLK